MMPFSEKQKRGVFITFEGGEGSGKSSQSKLLAERLLSEKHNVILTREPGGSPGAEEIREYILTGKTDRWDPLTESLLFLAARSDHWTKLIEPSLLDNKIVISDRFHDSSVVYQGLCKNISLDFLDYVFKFITKNRLPDRTYLLKIDPKKGVERSVSRQSNKETRFESMEMDFHEKVMEGFLNLAKQD